MRDLISEIARHLPEESYLVGGFVRDYLLGREINDIDIALKGDPKHYAHLLAERLKGSYFGFSKNNVPARGEVYTVYIPYKGEMVRVDLSGFEDLKADLSERDFTINALAWKLSDFLKGEKRIIDPFGGLKDLKQRVIRAVSPRVLENDPLRMLRAYRLAQSLGFSIDPATREFIRQKGELIKKVAPERVLNELLKIFAKGGGAKTLSLLKEDKFDRYLFGFEIPEESLKGVESFEKLQREGFTEKLKRETDFGEKTFLGEFDADTLLKLAIFLYPTRRWEEFLRLYPFGEDATKFVKNTLEGYRLLKKLPLEDTAEKHRYLKRFSKYLYPIGVLSKIYGDFERFAKILDFYNRWKSLSKPLLGGREIINLFGIKPSPLVGEILESLVLAQLEGKVRDKTQAVGFVKGFLRRRV